MLFVFFLVVKMSQEESKWANSIYFGELSLHLGSLLRLKWRLLYCQDIQVRDRRQVPEIGLQWPLFNNPFGTHTSETDDVVLAIILYPQTSWVLWCFMTFPAPWFFCATKWTDDVEQTSFDEFDQRYTRVLVEAAHDIHDIIPTATTREQPE